MDVVVIRNISPDTRSLFRADAPPVFPEDEVSVSTATFVGLAWPKDTWAVVTPPEGNYIDASSEDAWLWLESPADPEADSDPEPDVVEAPSALGTTTTKKSARAAKMEG